MKNYIKIAVMNKNILLIIMLLTLLLCRVNMLFSQEWEYSLEYGPYDNEMLKLINPLELSDGNIAIASFNHYRRGNSSFFYSADPAIVILSSDGNELARRVFHREGGYTSITGEPYLFEKDGNLFALFTYSPEHNYDSPDYFLNYDNPPSDAILSFCKLDQELNIIDSCEYRFPIDTFEDSEWWQWQDSPNEFSGQFIIFSLFEDKGDIIGGYIKTVSADYDNPRGDDSLFIFRMNFDGEILNKKGYAKGTHGIGSPRAHYTENQIVATDSHYILYAMGDNSKHGKVLYYDKELNHVTTKYIIQPGYYIPQIEADPLKNISVIKLNDTTTYLTVTASCIENPLNDFYNDVRLYKLNDNIENASDFLSTDNYIIRGYPETYEMALCYKGVEMANDNTSIYFACNYNMYDTSIDPPYSMIEWLNTDMDTISTIFLDKSIESIIMMGDGSILASGLHHIAKFPASAFVSIEEAHAHGLKVAVAYPNPGGDVMNVRTSLRDCTLQVYDMQGRMVHQQEITDDVTSVDASSWSSGTYVWELGTENGSGILESGKWVK